MHLRSSAALAALLLTTGALAACASSPSPTGASSATASASVTNAPAAPGTALTVTDPWVKATDAGMTGSFAVLRNTGPSDVTVVSASSPVAATAELHETVVKDGATVMQPKPGGFVVPAGGELALEPGGNHVMLMELSSPLRPGDEVAVTLTLASGDTVPYRALVKEFSGAQESYRPSGSAGTGGMDMPSSGS